jgi:GT2 family glycosyltransferase
LDTVGLFDEGFYFWYEDADLCYRLKEAGWKVCYLAESEVLHWGSSSFKKLMRSQKAAMAFNSLFYYFAKHSAGPKALLVRAALVLILVARLPIAAAFEMSTKDNRREWKNTAREYWRLLRWLVVPNK